MKMDAFQRRSRNGPRLSSRPSWIPLRYAELIKDPLKTVKSIYASFGWAVSPAFEGAIVAYLAEIKAKRGKTKKLAKFHAYTLEEYGLAEAEVDAEFSKYAEAHLMKIVDLTSSD